MIKRLLVNTNYGITIGNNVYQTNKLINILKYSLTLYKFDIVIICFYNHVCLFACELLFWQQWIFTSGIENNNYFDI